MVSPERQPDLCIEQSPKGVIGYVSWNAVCTPYDYISAWANTHMRR